MTLNPWPAYCSCNASSPVYCGVRPHLDATLTSSSDLAAVLGERVGSPARVLIGWSKMVMASLCWATPAMTPSSAKRPMGEPILRTKAGAAGVRPHATGADGVAQTDAPHAADAVHAVDARHAGDAAPAAHARTVATHARSPTPRSVNGSPPPRRSRPWRRSLRHRRSPPSPRCPPHPARSRRRHAPGDTGTPRRRHAARHPGASARRRARRDHADVGPATRCPGIGGPDRHAGNLRCAHDVGPARPRPLARPRQRADRPRRRARPHRPGADPAPRPPAPAPPVDVDDAGTARPRADLARPPRPPARALAAAARRRRGDDRAGRRRRPSCAARASARSARRAPATPPLRTAHHRDGAGGPLRRSRAAQPGQRRRRRLRGARRRHGVYFAGDTDLFEAMGTLGPVDVALVPICGWGRRSARVTSTRSGRRGAAAGAPATRRAGALGHVHPVGVRRARVARPARAPLHRAS